MADDLYLLASEAPGVLDDSPLRVEVNVYTDPDDPTSGRSEWRSGIWHLHRVYADWNLTVMPYPDDPRHPCWQWVRLPLSRPEVRDRLCRWLVDRWVEQHRDAVRVVDGTISMDYLPPSRAELKARADALRDSFSDLLAEVKAVAATLTPPAP